MDPADDLEAAVARGKARKRAEARENSRLTDARRARELEDAKRAASLWCVWASRDWWYIVGAVGAVSAFMVATGVIFPRYQAGVTHVELTNPALHVGASGLGLAAAAGAFLMFARSTVPKAWAREQAWLAALPFETHGYQDFLASGYNYLKLQLTSTTPDRETLTSVAAGLDAPRTRLEVKSVDPVELRCEVWRAPTMRAHWVAWHAIVDQVLLPIHAKHPIASVTIA